MFRTMSRRTSLAAVPLALTMAAAGLTGVARAAGSEPVQAAAATAAAPASAINWTACQSGFQCANVSVPLDYDSPSGKEIKLSVVRLRAADPGRRIGSLFLNPGGPGGSGVDLARGIAPYLPLELRGRFDIVGFDPRGVARSTPLRCFNTFEEALGVLGDYAYPITTKQELDQSKKDAALAAACKSHGGDIARHMSTADVARDMDFLRNAVGDRKLNYLGFSYGTQLGQTYANLFPQRVRSVVLDGVLDPISWTSGRGSNGTRLPFTSRIRSDQGAKATLAQFFKLCDKGADCKFSGNSAKRFAALLKKLPVEYNDANTVPTQSDLIAITLGVMYGPEIWSDYARWLTDLEAYVNGDGSAKAVDTSMAKLRRKLGAAAPTQEEYPNFIEGFPGVGCSDSTNPSKLSAWQRAADDADKKYGYFGRIWTWTGGPCRTWTRDAHQDRYTGPWTARTANPVLIVGNYYDPATAYHGAVTANRLLPGSRLLSYAGWGHTAYLLGNYCVDSRVTDYLVTGRLPRAGTVCQPNADPFEPFEAVAAASAGAGAAKVLRAQMLPPAVREAIGR